MFELMPSLLVPEGPDDVRLEEDLDAELAALLTDPRARWTAADLEDLAAAAAAWPSEDPEAPVEALEGQINRLRCLLAAARADLEDAAAQHAVLRADRDTALQRADAALEHRAAAVQERNAAHAEAQAAHAALSSALVDLALTRAEATLPEVYDPTTLTQHLHDTPPGPALATAVATAVTPGTLGRLPDDTLIELAAATGRITSWAAAAQLAAVAAYADRVAASPLAGDDHGDAVAIAELALACGVSRYAMAKTLTTAQVLPRDFPHLHHALATGGLDPAKARLVVEKTLCHGNSVLAAVEEGVLPVIVQITKPQLAELIDRLIAQADPAAHHERAAEARTERRVTFRPAGHGMATMNLFAAAEDVEAVRAVLNAATLAARQAQPDLPGRAHVEDPDRPNTPADPDGRHPAATRADTLIDLILGTTPAAAPAPAPARADVTVLIPFSVLFGDDDTPCDLRGYGPVPAQLARELAADGTWRCAAVDDRPDSPTHGTVLGLGRSAHTAGYIPTAATRAFVQLRDRRCRFPGCRQPAQRCDLDHRTPWCKGSADGATCDCNLHPLCRHHHQLKQRGFIPEPTPTGATQWTTPAGRTYTAHPERLPG